MIKKWLIKDQPDIVQVEKLKSELGVSEVVAYLLVQRGITTFDESKAFFRGTLAELHNPFLMKDMEKAVKRVNNALENKEKILIYGDYDVDGTTSVSLVYSFLSQYTSSIEYYIPNRYKEGYGVSEAGVNYAKENDFSLVITLDCGIKANEMVDLANSHGIDFIICDHHTPGEELPNAIVLDPKREDCAYPYKGLSGCGVGFKLMQALTETNAWEEGPLFDNLDLLAISIGADIVPVTGENRLLAQYGLKHINESPKLRIGLDVMLNLAKKEKPLTLTDVVFTIAPRINAAGRMDDAKAAVELLISDDDTKARTIAKEIQQLNDERKELDKQITEEALAIIKKDTSFSHKCTTVVCQKDWHKGVLGIVASRLIENHYRPTIVLTLSDDGTWTGSARSIEDVNIYNALKACEDEMIKFGGHNAAAGLSIKEENIERFKQRFDEEVRKLLNPESLIPEILVEKELPFNELFTTGDSIDSVPRLMRVLQQFEPHGPENMKPRFIARNVFAQNPRLLKGEHLKMKVFQPDFKRYIDAIYFFAPDALDMVNNRPFDMVFTLNTNEFRGKSTPQLMVKDLRPTQGGGL